MLKKTLPKMKFKISTYFPPKLKKIGGTEKATVNGTNLKMNLTRHFFWALDLSGLIQNTYLERKCAQFIEAVKVKIV